MDTKDEIKYIKYLRGQLIRGEQMEMANKLGYSYSHVKGVLMGYYKNDEIKQWAEKRIYTRACDTIINCVGLFDQRPDLLTCLFSTLENSKTVC